MSRIQIDRSPIQFDRRFDSVTLRFNSFRVVPRRSPVRYVDLLLSGAIAPSGYTRCRLHGGASTGPRTPEGLARSQKARWLHGEFSATARLQSRSIRQLGKIAMNPNPVAREAVARRLGHKIEKWRLRLREVPAWHHYLNAIGPKFRVAAHG